MDLTLSWDLFVIVFFGIVISYSFIIGKHESVKIIVFTYIAMVAGQGAGNIAERFTGEIQPFLTTFGLSVDINIMGSTKLLIFIATIIFLAIRGGFEVEYSRETGSIVSIIIVAVFGFATAGLLLSTLLTFVVGAPLLGEAVQDQQLQAIAENSTLMHWMIEYQDVWFALPALLLIVIGILSHKED